MKIQHSKELSKISHKTKLTREDISNRIESVLRTITEVPETYKDVHDWLGSEWMGIKISDWLGFCDEYKPLEALSMIADAICDNTGVKPNRVIYLIPNLTVLGSGDCPSCGGNGEATGESSGETYGDGYFEQMEFVGVVEKECVNCKNLYQTKE